MKIKLFNGSPILLNLRVLSGGFDADTGKMVLIVTGENNAAGTIALDVTEARDVTRILAAQAPDIAKVEAVLEDAPAVVRSIAKEK